MLCNNTLHTDSGRDVFRLFIELQGEIPHNTHHQHAAFHSYVEEYIIYALILDFDPFFWHNHSLDSGFLRL